MLLPKASCLLTLWCRCQLLETTEAWATQHVAAEEHGKRMVSIKNQLAMLKHELKGAAGTRWKLESKTLKEQVADLKSQASKDKLALARKAVSKARRENFFVCIRARAFVRACVCVCALACVCACVRAKEMTDTTDSLQKKPAR
jgi:hypothetical protein